MSDRRTVLITGGSGVVGRAVAAELRDHHVIALGHSDTDVPEADEVLAADLTEPKLGLADDVWHELAERVDIVVHSGALTEWGQPWERYQTINIDGTVRTVEFAKAARAPIHFVSSAFVHAIERFGPDHLRPGNVVTPYIVSKLECERLVADSGLPYSIHRPTNIVGDSRTGASSRPQIVLQLSNWMARGKAPYLPLHAGNLMDFVPLDVTAHAIARGVEGDELDGQLFWHTYGADAMTAHEAFGIVREHARELGREIDTIPVVDPDEPLPVPLDQIAPVPRRYLQVLIDTSEVTRASGGVLPTSLADLRDRLGVPTVSDRDAYRLSLRYWA
jgi:nucleoside-diphosphate-sugar epimerase